MTPGLSDRLAGYLARRPRRGPETVHIDVTNTCNLDCVTCWNYAPGLSRPKSAAWKQQRIDPARFRQLVAECAEAGAERIIVSGGGEPFSHPAIHEFIATVKAHGLLLTIISNGTLCDYARLATDAAVPDQMLINVAAGSPATYAAYHPNQPPETFDRLIDDLRRIAGRIRINLVQVIHRLNYGELPEMIDLAAGIGARSSFKLGDTPAGTESLALEPEQRRDLIERLIPAALKRAKAVRSRHNLDAFLAQLAGPDDSRFVRECFAGYLYARISVEGRIFFCCEHIDVGHVDRGPLAAQWIGADWQAVRDRLHAGRFYPGCRRCGKYDMNHDAGRTLAAVAADGRAR